jgi:2-polyprenyl-6-methoxyphenol hydroxylase-like FAD-dependent oxidoreductase
VNVSNAAPPALGRETVLIVGGGMAGLSLALALEGSDKQLVIVERDPAPPEIAPHEAFESWKRAGVGQFRHPHVFVGRLHGLLRKRHPQLLSELEQAGFRASTLAEHLPPALREGYVAQPDDCEIAPLYGRRATFEYVLRRYVGRLPNVRFVHDSTVQGLLHERTQGGALRITGLELKRADVRESLHGDVIIDAAGRNSPLRGWLEALGARIELRHQPSNLAYFCRHYQLRPGEAEPDHRDLSADLDYLKYAIFYAERGHFAIAFGCAEQENDLVELLRRPEGFENMCRQIPALAAWVARAEPVTKVLGAAKISNRRARIAASPQVLGMFLLGDAAFEANPIYGRGCAAAFLQSQLLAETLCAHSDPAQRAREYEKLLRIELDPHHNASVMADRLFHSRADRARGLRPGPAQALLLYGYESVIVPAVLADMSVAREILGTMAMGKPAGLQRVLQFIVRVVRIWLFRPRTAALQLPPPPERADLLARATGAVAVDSREG